VEQNLYGIGELAALSGLSISALRFYDGAGVLPPARVDAATGYRKYAAAQLRPARLIARLRRVGLPLAEIRLVLAEPVGIGLAVLDAHLQRLENGLVDARRELSTVRTELAHLEHPMTVLTMPASRFVDAVTEVRYAASIDSELPMLCGILLDLDANQTTLRLVATDRFRLAVSTAVPDSVAGESIAVLLPTGLIDSVLTRLAELADLTAPLSVRLSSERVIFGVSGAEIAGEALPHEFPDYQRLVRLPAPSRRVTVSAAELHREVSQAPTRTMTRDRDGAQYQVSTLVLDRAGALQVGPARTDPDALAVGVNREFLLQALAVGQGQLTLELDGPIGPLAIRDADADGSFSILMPVRL
jgi:DNA polymerase III sliding clamp (beta) subunit (PCNA family)